MVLAAVGVIAFSGPVAAGSWDSNWYELQCTTGGGAYGDGQVKARAWIQEFGFSGTNYFVIKARWQQSENGSTGWFLAWNDGSAKQAKSSATFPNNNQNYIFDRPFKFSFHNPADYSDWWNRIRFIAQAWDARPGADVLLYQRTFSTDSC
jgi:hypothetical protein